MAYNGSGSYNPPAPQYPAIPGNTIAAEDFNTIIADLAAALSLAITKDGQQTWTGNQNMGGMALLNGSIDGAVTGTTQPAGTNTAQLATMAALQQATFAATLPGQTGNAGKVLTTNGTAASWTSTLTGMLMQGVEESALASNSNSALSLDCSLYNAFNILLNANTTLSTINVPSAGVFRLRLVLRQDVTGGRTVTWPASVKWACPIPSPFSSTANTTMVVLMCTFDGGTNWYATLHTPQPAVTTQSPSNKSTAPASTAYVDTAAPAGSVLLWPLSTAPTGYLKANGAAVSRTTYANLFAAIGTAFGAGDGSTTFNVPELRGEFPRFTDDGRGVDSGRAVGSAQAAAIVAHNHGISDPGHNHTLTDPGHLHSTYVDVNIGPSSWNSGSLVTGVSRFGSTSGHLEPIIATTTGITLAGASTGVTTTNTGGTETRPRNIALLACIKY